MNKGDVKFKMVLAGSGFNKYGVSESGILYSWGSSDGISVIPVSPVVADSVDGYTLDGKLGGKYVGNVKSVEGSTDGFVALLNDGHAVCNWNLNDFQTKYVKFSDGTLLENIAQVSAGDNSFYFVTKDGRCYAIGSQNGNNNKAKDELVPVLDNSKNPLTGIKAIEGGDVMAFALAKDGRLYSWGNGGYGGCTGQGVTASAVNAKNVVAGGYESISGEPYLTNVRQVSAGRAFALAVTNDGHALYWGVNDKIGGVAPLDTTEFLPAPVLLKYNDGSVVEDAVAVSTWDLGGYLINEKGEVYSFGYNKEGQCGVGSDKEVVKELTLMSLPCDIANDYVNVSFNAEKLTFCEGDAVRAYISSVSGNSYNVEWSYNGSKCETNDDVCPYMGDGLYKISVSTSNGNTFTDSVYIEVKKPEFEVEVFKNEFPMGTEKEGLPIEFSFNVPDKSDVYVYSDQECSNLLDSIIGAEGKQNLSYPIEDIQHDDSTATIWLVKKKSTVMNVIVPKFDNKTTSSYFMNEGLILQVDEPTSLKSFSMFAKGDGLDNSSVMITPELYLATTCSITEGYTYGSLFYEGQSQAFDTESGVVRECVVDCDVTLQPGVYVLSAVVSYRGICSILSERVPSDMSTSGVSTSFAKPVADTVVGGIQIVGAVCNRKDSSANPSNNVDFFNFSFERVMGSQCGATECGAKIDFVIYQGIDTVVSQPENAQVDVYSTSGVLLRKDVARVNALEGLPAGVYVVGNEKVVKTNK